MFVTVSSEMHQNFCWLCI